MNNIPHSDGLYPDWDEFYLAVCDICEMIIKPQALEKHLASKHGINVLKSLPLQNGHNHQNNHTNNHHNHHNHHHNNHHHPTSNHNHTITTNNNNSKSKSSVTCQLPEAPQAPPLPDSNTTAVPANNNIANPPNASNHNSHPNNAASSAPATNGTSNANKTTTSNNDPTEQTNSNSTSTSSKCLGGKQSLDSSPKPAASGRPPCLVMRMRYRGAKWRNTYDVLKDVLF